MQARSPILAAALAFALAPVAVAQTVRLGAHYGVDLTQGHWEQERLGVQGEVRVLGPLAMSGAFSAYLNYPGSPVVTGSAWQFHANARLRAPGMWSFASVGYGFVVLHQSLQAYPQPGTTIRASDSQITDTAVFGLEAPLRYVRPFADLYLMYLLDHRGQVGVNLLMGLQVPLP
jgi:hypothetical protein